MNVFASLLHETETIKWFPWGRGKCNTVSHMTQKDPPTPAEQNTVKGYSESAPESSQTFYSSCIWQWQSGSLCGESTTYKRQIRAAVFHSRCESETAAHQTPPISLHLISTFPALMCCSDKESDLK